MGENLLANERERDKVMLTQRVGAVTAPPHSYRRLLGFLVFPQNSSVNKSGIGDSKAQCLVGRARSPIQACVSNPDLSHRFLIESS